MNNDIILSMGKYTYVAKIEKKEDDGIYYYVEFPALQGCITYGNTLEEAISMAKDALKGYLSWLKDEGKPLPKEKTLLNKRSSISIPLSVSV